MLPETLAGYPGGSPSDVAQTPGWQAGLVDDVGGHTVDGRQYGMREAGMPTQRP